VVSNNEEEEGTVFSSGRSVGQGIGVSRLILGGETHPSTAFFPNRPRLTLEDSLEQTHIRALV